MQKLKTCLILLIVSLSNIYAGVGFKGIGNIEIDSQSKYAYFPILYDNWVNYNIGVFDIENNELLKEMKILENYPDYTLSGITLLSDNILIATISNRNYWKQGEPYTTKLLFLDINSEELLKTVDYKNDTIKKMKAYNNLIYLIFESGKFLAITESSSSPIFQYTIKDIHFPEMKINDDIATLTHNNRDSNVSVFNSNSGEFLSEIRTESAIIDLYVDNKTITILHHNSMEKFNIQGELISKENFREFDISPCKQLISSDIILMRINEKGSGVYHLFSLSNNRFVKIPIEDNIHISKIFRLDKNRIMLGLADVVGIFQPPEHLPNELIKVVNLNDF